ncbi:Eukaryotic translation initiation factor 3 subunit D, partial [Irineochytrium annulatum]
MPKKKPSSSKLKQSAVSSADNSRSASPLPPVDVAASVPEAASDAVAASVPRAAAVPLSPSNIVNQAPIPSVTASSSSAKGGLSQFKLPEIQDNPTGWGPSKIPFNLTQIPYAPFSKSDRLGKIADWTVPADMMQPRDGGGMAGGDGREVVSQRRRGFRGMGAEAFGTGT